jgi:metacaspase-1
MPSLRVLCVHGVGDHHTSTTWEADWQAAVRSAVAVWDANLTVEFDFLLYDDLFEKYPLDPATYAEAIYKLGGSGIAVGVNDAVNAVEGAIDQVGQAVGGAVNDVATGIGGLFRSRGLADIPAELRWTAGMVAQWADSDGLRAESRTRVTDAIRNGQPHVIVAHSLGTLICYDTASRDQGVLANRTFIAFGSQIGNPFVRSTFGGYVGPLDQAREWFQLYNPNDRAFSAPIDVFAANFRRVLTPFFDGFLSHDAIRYLTHPSASGAVWQFVAAAAGGSRVFAPVAKAMAASQRAARKPNRRALLVGINEYPDPQNRLDGCVNDAFLVSAALQESGFDPEDIRVVADDRATAAGILDRLHWLLDGTAPGDERVFFYSGHGAQIPSYGVGDEVDHLNECLCPYNFDWSPARAIADDQFMNLYSQLPYDSHFVAMFDCCHSGGMSRAGGGAKVRGITPPDDVRHRDLRWNWRLQMWEPRALAPVTPDKSISGKDSRKRDAYVGAGGAKERLGRAIPLRQLAGPRKQKQRAATGHPGPFMPVVVEACQEDQLSYEYRHGVTSYGAFTFALTKTLSQARQRRRGITFHKLVEETTRQLRELHYEQTPCLVGPTAVLKKPIPWHGGGLVGAKTG